MTEKKITAEERMMAVSFNWVDGHLLWPRSVTYRDAVGVVAEVTRELDEARADLEKCAERGWYGLVENERRRANEANAAVSGLAEERTRAVVRAERVERERDEARAALLVLRQSVQAILVDEGCACECWDDEGGDCQHGELHRCPVEERCTCCRIEAALKAADGGEVTP